MRKQITLEAWAEAQFDPPPSRYTLRKWARNCRIFPVPQKVGREYRVDPHARYIGNNYENMNGTEAA